MKLEDFQKSIEDAKKKYSCTIVNYTMVTSNDGFEYNRYTTDSMYIEDANWTTKFAERVNEQMEFGIMDFIRERLPKCIFDEIESADFDKTNTKINEIESLLRDTKDVERNIESILNRDVSTSLLACLGIFKTENKVIEAKKEKDEFYSSGEASYFSDYEQQDMVREKLMKYL